MNTFSGLRIASAATVMVGTLLNATLVADAEQGAAISVARVEFPAVVAPGERHEVRQIRVSNPGSEAADYLVEVRKVDPSPPVGRDGPPVQPDASTQGPATTIDPGQAVDPSWFTVTPARLSLAPGHTEAVTITMSVPADAEPERYQGLLSAAIQRDGPGATVGAAAAARIDFRVDGTAAAGPDGPATGGTQENNRLDLPLAWLAGVAAGLLALAILVKLSRRYSLRIERRH